MARGVSAKAQQAEEAAFKKLKTSTRGKPIVSPAGFDAGFPDFAFRVSLPNGKVIDLHFEYKADYKAQMGSMRDWKFDGTKFYTVDKTNEAKADLITIMNATPEAIKNGKRLLRDLKKFFDKGVKEISSGALSIIKDKAERRAKTVAFVEGTDNYQIANISNSTMGAQIITHYKRKFKKNLHGGADGSILFMMLKDKVWMVDKHGKVSADDMMDVARILKIDKIDKMGSLNAKLEVRIQPRGLNSPNKPTSIDVMASFRLAAAPTGGGKVV